jgi:hypothetical protein
MLEGEDVPGIPGEPEVHKKVHVEQLRIINKDKGELEQLFEQLPPELMPTALQSEQGQRFQELAELAARFATHLMNDDQPKMMEVPSAVEGAQPPQAPQVPMPPGLTPAGGSQPPMPAGGNQQSGMGPALPEQGRPPMAQAGI